MQNIFSGTSFFYENQSSCSFFLDRFERSHYKNSMIYGTGVSIFNGSEEAHSAVKGISTKFSKEAYLLAAKKNPLIGDFFINQHALNHSEIELNSASIKNYKNEIENIISILNLYKEHHYLKKTIHLKFFVQNVFIKSCFLGRETIIGSETRIKFGLSLDTLNKNSNSIETWQELSLGLNQLPSLKELEHYLNLFHTISYAELTKKCSDITPAFYTCVFVSQAACVLVHEVFGHLTEKQNFNFNSSKFKNSIPISIYDNANDSTLFGFRKFDDLGSPTQKITLFEEGSLINILNFKENNNYSAQRENFMHPPLSRMSNTVVENGQLSINEIIDLVGTGIIIAKIVLAYFDNKNTGITIHVSEAYEISMGKIRNKLYPFTIRTNATTFINNITNIADDSSTISMFCKSYNSIIPVSTTTPSLQINNLPVKKMSTSIKNYISKNIIN